MKNLKNLGVVLSRIEQQTINGGICKCRIKVPGQPQQIERVERKCCGYSGCPAC